MDHFFTDPGNIRDKHITIEGTDVNHIRNVLRLRPGDEISVSNGIDGKEYRCGIVSIGDTVECELRFIKEESVELPIRVHLFQGLCKGDKMETVIQKTTELGVYEVIPVQMIRSVVRLDDKKAASKVGRYAGVAEAAAKQSKRGVIPQIHSVCDMNSAIEYANGFDKIIAPYELAAGESFDNTRKVMDSVKGLKDIAVFIGPEGGFDASEIEALKAAGAETVSLGRRILRTETAGMTVLSWLVYLLES